MRDWEPHKFGLVSTSIVECVINLSESNAFLTSGAAPSPELAVSEPSEVFDGAFVPAPNNFPISLSAAILFAANAEFKSVAVEYRFNYRKP